LLRVLDRRFRGIDIVVGTPFIYLEESSTLIMADLHLGFEEAASRGLHYSLRKTSGYYAIFLPRVQLKRALEMLKRVLEGIKVKRVVINGDLKHAFDRLLKQEREETIELVKFLRERGVEEILVIRGNHDNFIKPVLRKLDVGFVNSLSTIVEGRRLLVTHGHEEVDISGHDVVIIGHEHPSLRCFEVYRLPCFLKIPLGEERILIVMPATGPYHPGVLVNPNPEEYLSPLIRRLNTLKDASIITWLDLGEASSSSVSYFESFSYGDLLLLERYKVEDREYAVVEFKTFEVAKAVCEM
jgi:putative SbcD/Mre11-related phosphoesterase